MAMASQASITEIITLGAIASSLLAVIALGKQVWSFLSWILKLLLQMIWTLILVPLGYILLWSMEGIVNIIDVIRRRLDKSAQLEQ